MSTVIPGVESYEIYRGGDMAIAPLTAECEAYLDPGGPLNVFVLGHRIEPGT